MFSNCPLAFLNQVAEPWVLRVLSARLMVLSMSVDWRSVRSKLAFSTEKFFIAIILAQLLCLDSSIEEVGGRPRIAVGLGLSTTNV